MLASQFFFEAEHSLQLVGHPQLLGDGGGHLLQAAQSTPHAVPFYDTHSH
jgi:hypothetical protein